MVRSGPKNVSGNDRAGMAPSALLVGPKQVTAARKFPAEIAAAMIADVNPYSGKLSLAIEDKYDGVAGGSSPANPHSSTASSKPPRRPKD